MIITSLSRTVDGLLFSLCCIVCSFFYFSVLSVDFKLGRYCIFHSLASYQVLYLRTISIKYVTQHKLSTKELHLTQFLKTEIAKMSKKFTLAEDVYYDISETEATSHPGSTSKRVWRRHTELEITSLVADYSL